VSVPRVSVPAPALLTVTVCGALLLPRTTVPKPRVVGFAPRSGAGAPATPVPDSGTFALPTLLAMDTVDALLPGEAGANWTFAVQLWPAANAVPLAQFPESRNSVERPPNGLPMRIDVSVSAPPPVLLMVSVRVADCPTVTLAKAMLCAESERTGFAGGVVSANCSGPRRRLYGTARDLVIGMTFATVEGKLVKTGGMVVKNVAGLDMGKLMIGSFGTLAAIAVVNFKLLPMPQVERLFLLSFDTLEAAIAGRDALLNSVLQPSSIDLLNPAAAQIVGWPGHTLAVQAGGNALVIDRYEKELRQMGSLRVADEGAFASLQEFTPWYLATHANGAVVRISCTLSQLGDVFKSINAPIVARAGTGVCYVYFDNPEAAEAVNTARKAIMEFAPEAHKPKLNLWPAPGPDFELMKRIKHMLDPEHLLNRGRLYRQI